MTEDEHPLTFERLVAHAFNELDEAEAAAISAHVATCLACAVSVARLQRLRDHLHRDNLLVPPLATLSRARAIFQQQRPAQRGWLPSVMQYAASGQARLAFGALLLAVSLGGGHAVAGASQAALPGDWLYPVKGMVEEVKLATSLDAVGRAQLHLAIVETRADEIVALAAQQRYDEIPLSVDNFRQQIDETATAVRIVAQSDSAQGARLVEQVEQSLSESAEVLAQPGNASPDGAEPSVQEAVRVIEAGSSLVRAQLATLATVAQAPTSTPESLLSPSPTSWPTATWPPTRTPLPTSTPTDRPTNTRMPTATETETPMPTATDTPIQTSTPVETPTFTAMPPPTDTAIPTESPTDTPAPTMMPTPTATETETPVPTATDTPMPTATETETPTPTATDTPMPTATTSPTASETGTATPTPTPTPTASETVTPTPKASLTPTSPTPTQTATEDEIQMPTEFEPEAFRKIDSFARRNPAQFALA